MTRARRLSLVALGGAAGGVARVLVAVFLPMAAEAPGWGVPLLLAVNLGGSLLAGFLRGVFERGQQAGTDAEADVEAAEALLLAGFCGGFTSYSGFIAVASAENAWITVVTLVGCPVAALAGMWLSGGYPARPAGNPR
jgi:fluoride ion exporter CrcB/FEX